MASPLTSFLLESFASAVANLACKSVKTWKKELIPWKMIVTMKTNSYRLPKKYFGSRGKSWYQTQITSPRKMMLLRKKKKR